MLDHLVLVGGGAADIAELAAPIDEGLYLPTLLTVRGWSTAVAEPVLIRDGALLDQDTMSVRLALDVFALLKAVQALTSTQWTIPTGDRSARTAGATVCPAMRVGGGLRVL